MNRVLVVFLFLTTAALAAQQKLDLKKLKAKFKSVKVSIDDPLYAKKMSFDAFSVNEILKDEIQSSDEIVFTALDGFAPSVPVHKFKEKKAFLAFRESGKNDGQFAMLKDEHLPKPVNPAPFYLVWEEGAKLGTANYPWAFQVVKVEAVKFSEKYADMIPGEDRESKAWRGFELFKTNCMLCHAINKQGGNVGPELNAPKNVTEYWKEDALKEYIPNAPAFRYGSKMPPFPQLKSDDVEAILKYLRAMQSRKI